MLNTKANLFKLVCVLGVVLLQLADHSVSNQVRSADAKETKTADEKPVDKAELLATDVTQGALRIANDDGTVVECPLEHTDVVADVSGFISRVKVTQTFRNPTKEKIEAVYVFPLPHKAAVDDMTMVLGDRRIVGIIKRRDDARRIYEQALSAGQTAALLEQERPNIFTQSVGNIEPGMKVNIEISYVDVLNYDMGTYEFHFPMVVGPRYNPQQSPGDPSDRTTSVANAPSLKPDERTGHDVSLSVNLKAGVPIQNLKNSNHKVHTIRKGDTEARVRLLQEDSIPNKDFLLRYEVVGEKPEMAMLAHTGDYSGDARRLGNGYFMLMIQPKEDERLKKSPPREVVFLVDVSGSMRGGPTAKVRDAMEKMIKLCREKDTMQVITFAGRANKLFEKPVPINDENRKRALDFTSGLRGGGGTEMLKGVKMAIDEPIDQERIRIVVMLTDGYIGNEAQIIEHVGENCGDQVRFWAIGMGQSPNMMLIDGVARQGGGMGKKLGLNDDTEPLTTEVMTRIQRAQLAKIKIDWGDLEVAATFPARIPELWAGRPVIVYGRYKDGNKSQVTVSGTVEGEPVSWTLDVALPKEQEEHDVLAKVWSRKKIEDLMHQTYYQGSPAIEEEVTAIALNYRLMSQYTSFVAVDAESAADLESPATPPRRMMVPVPLPEGTQWEGFFGEGGGGIGGGGDDAVFSFYLGLERKKAKNLEKLSQRVDQLHRPQAATFLNSFGRPSRSLHESYEMAYRMQTPKPALGRYAAGGVAYGGFATPANGISAGLAIQLANKRQLSTATRRGWAYQPHAPAPGQPSAGRGIALPGLAVDFEVSDEAEDANGAVALPASVWNAFGSLTTKHSELAKALLSDAKQLREKEQREAARLAFVRAFYLDSVATGMGVSDGQVSSEALTALNEIHAAYVESCVKKNEALGKKLDLVLRDKSIEEALAGVSTATGIKIKVTKGSVEDAESLLVGVEPRISYLDLRRATAAQALDWILQPVQMQWRLDDASVTVATLSRTEGQSPWIYDVSAIAIPSADELKEIKDQAKAMEATKKLAEQFVAGLRQPLKLDEQNIQWYGIGQILITGSIETHGMTRELLRNLGDVQYKPSKELAELHKVTSQRAKDRQERLTKVESARHLMQVASAHDQFGWRLLAAASNGDLDLEALTKLQIAWRDEATAKLLDTHGAALALRSLWMISESSRALPDEHELAELSELAKQKSQQAGKQAIEALSKKAEDQAAYTQLLFAALAATSNGDGQFVKQALPLLTKSKDPTATLAEALLGNSPTKQIDTLVRVVNNGVAGEELVVLTAMACRRAGGEAWTTFRSKSQQIVGKQPLRGEVVLIVNRLASPLLPMAVAKK